MGKFGIADLQNTRQRETLLVHVLSIACRSRFARDDFHAVGSFHRIEWRNIFEIKKPAAPGAVVGIGAMKDRKVRWVGAILDEIEPVIIVLAGWLERPLSVWFNQRFILRQWRRALLVGAHVGENQSADFSNGIG